MLKETLLGNQASCGKPEAEMSKPSSCVEGGTFLTRSRSQILWFVSNLIDLRIRHTELSWCPLCVPISATFTLGSVKVVAGCKR